MHKESWIGLVGDSFVRGNLEAPVVWTYWDALPGVLLIAGVVAAVVWFGRDEPRKAVTWLFATTTVVFMAVLPVFTPRIEAITQRAPVEFYRSLIGRQCYVRALGFKSYAPYFYMEERPDQSAAGRSMSPAEFEPWLLDGNIDRPAYFVCRVQDVGKVAKHAALREIGRRNGFGFFQREPDAR
jgi:hypothetical protein